MSAAKTTRLRPLRDFAMLDEDWYEDDVLVAIAEETTPMVFAYVPMLIGRCREHSHVDENPLGWLQITMKTAARFLCDEPGRGESTEDWMTARKSMWLELKDGEIIDIEGDLESRFRTRLLRFSKYQTPKGSITERTREHKGRAGVSTSLGTISERNGNAGEHTGTHRDRDIEKEENTSEVNLELVPVEKTSKHRPVDSELERRIENCFDWYCKLFNKTGRASIEMTKRRHDRIEWALKKYGGDVVAECLRGYYSDPWRQSDLTRNDIRKLLGSPEAVEAGLEKARAGSADPSNQDASLLTSLGYDLGGAA